MTKVNKILTRHIKPGIVRDMDEERFDQAYIQATEELEKELGEIPNDRAITERAYKILAKGK